MDILFIILLHYTPRFQREIKTERKYKPQQVHQRDVVLLQRVVYCIYESTRTLVCVIMFQLFVSNLIATVFRIYHILMTQHTVK